MRIEGVRDQYLPGDEIGSRFVGRGQDHGRSHPRIERLLPARCAQAPPIAGPQPREARARRGEVVAAARGEREELGRHLGADDVPAQIGRVGVAAAGTKKSGQRLGRARLEREAEEVALV